MALVCVALVFTLKERIAQGAHLPLLSVQNIVELLEIYLPRRPQTPTEVLAAMSRRQQGRQKSIDFARKKRGKPKLF
jgi:hypothetical protein